MAVGLLLLQLVWLFTVPPFRGSDEFDHAYRAAAVARGQWIVAPVAATRGTGAWLHVPADIVSAARPECQRLIYTHDNDCVGTPHGSDVRVASGAGRYHPFFYAIIGTPALPFDGVTALYVMRLTTILLSAALFLLALWAARLWARTSWPLCAVVVAATPMLLYSSSVAAPNGPEMMAGLALWTSGVGLLDPRLRERRTSLMGATAAAAALLATFRSLGPLFVLLVAGTLLVALRPPMSYVRELVRSRAVLVGAGVVLLAAVQSVVWILLEHSLQLSVTRAHATMLHKVRFSLGQIPLWILQSIGAFPLRDMPTHPVVYLTYLVLFGWLLLLGLRAARSHVRQALLLGVAISVALPLTISVSSYTTSQGSWQGRYGLPYAVGMCVLAGLALDRRQIRPRPTFVYAGLALFAVAQTVAPAKLLHDERASSPMLALHLWPAPQPWIVVVVAALASGCAWLGAARASPPALPSRTS